MFLFLERLPPVPNILPPVWPFSILMPHTASRWGSCGHPSDVLCSQRENTEPCSTISPKILFWKTLRPRGAEISSVTQKEMVGVHLMLLLQICFCRHSIINCCLQPLSMNIKLYFFFLQFSHLNLQKGTLLISPPLLYSLALILGVLCFQEGTFRDLNLQGEFMFALTGSDCLVFLCFAVFIPQWSVIQSVGRTVFSVTLCGCK